MWKYSLFIALCLAALTSAVPMDQPFIGYFTYYNDTGVNACGEPFDANSESFVAVSGTYFTEANSNDDPICRLCLTVDYKGKSKKVTVPIKDKCPSCAADHMMLSLPAFEALESPTVGNVGIATFTFVGCQ